MRCIMPTGIRLIVEHYNISSNEIISSTIINDEELCKATTLKYLGYSHSEQIDIIKKLQDIKVNQQILLNSPTTCPICNNRTFKDGKFKSELHAALTDSKVMVQRVRCKCGWHSPTSVEGIFGTSVHPDLLQKQALQGSKESYAKSGTSLNAESVYERSINNHTQIMRAVNKVSQALEELRKHSEANLCASELIANIDGGHIKSRGMARSFEAMVATVYRPENLKLVANHSNEITDKTTVASAKDDSQETMKQLFIAACTKQGMSIKSTVTCLADGAENCRDIADSIKPYCKKVVYILDWFHIAMRFKNIAIPAQYQEQYKKIKLNLWHGNFDKAIQRFKEFLNIYEIASDDKLVKKISNLLSYIVNNKDGITDYAARRNAGLPFTSNLAESTVNTLINERQKGQQKMLWSREGAHSILQIRASVFSKTWEQDWAIAENMLYSLAA